MHFGSTLRLLRVDAGVSVRELARRVGVSSAYLSRVENGWDPPPTPDRLFAVADALGLSRAALVDLARQAGAAVERYVDRVPAAGALFVHIADRDLDTAQIARIKAFVDQEFPTRRRPQAGSLAALLPLERIVVGFVGRDVRDLVEIAATRVPLPDGYDPGRIVEQLMAREAEASTCIGGGIVAPHAAVPGIAAAVVVVTTARPLDVPSPDGEPVRVGIVVLSDGAGPTQLEVLARVARLASYGVAGELAAAPSPRDVRAIVERLESLW